MSIEHPTENWTRFPNSILDNLDRYSGNELKVLALMIRKNLGWRDPNKKYAVKYIAAKTGLSKPTARKAIGSLLEKAAIDEISSGKRCTRRFESNLVARGKGEKASAKKTEAAVPKAVVRPKIQTVTREKNLPVPVKDFPPSTVGTGKKILPVQVKKFDRNMAKILTQYKKPVKETRGKKPAAPHRLFSKPVYTKEDWHADETDERLKEINREIMEVCGGPDPVWEAELRALEREIRETW
ncbi:MAG: hypothetical protein RBT16_12035 [Desulfococcus multivorans]|jgi:hypothetical protein|nr:hypothetical protein [Desulfococcus multivorans]